MMEGMNSITPHAKTGRVRSLAVSGARRSDALPEVPTMAEAGVPGYEASTWNGIVGPAGIPKAVVIKLNGEINKALGSTTLRERFAAIGADPAPGTPEQFAELIRREDRKWSEVVKRSGAKID
jgi:tripartite-type tricarboxylate transporter receptor subunit TctC